MLDRFWCTRTHKKNIISNVDLGNSRDLSDNQPQVMFRFGGSVIYNHGLSLYSYHIKPNSLEYTGSRSCLQPLSPAISNVHSSHIAWEGTEEFQINDHRSRQWTEKGSTAHITDTQTAYTALWGVQLQGPQTPPRVFYKYIQPMSATCQICHIPIIHSWH